MNLTWVGRMHSFRDQAELGSGERINALSSPRRPNPSAAPNLEDPGAKQCRKLALMAAISEGLPTLPAYVFELNGLLSATPVNLKRVGEVIRTDPSLSAQVLRLCNSAFMGIRERVATIEHAMILVGTERLRTLVLTCSLIEYVGRRLASEDVQSFWQHCFLTATLSERLARGVSYPQPEQAYIAGLLHDIGAMPLLVIASTELTEPELVTACVWGESLELEREHFGIDHCEVGHWIGVSWNFASTLLEVMESHHNLGGASLDRSLVGVVAAADRFCARRGIAMGGVPPELSKTAVSEDQAILQACLPQLQPGEVDKFVEMLESDYLHLVQLMELGAAGLFGGGIPKNPFREQEG